MSTSKTKKAEKALKKEKAAKLKLASKKAAQLKKKLKLASKNELKTKRKELETLKNELKTKKKELETNKEISDLKNQLDACKKTNEVIEINSYDWICWKFPIFMSDDAIPGHNAVVSNYSKCGNTNTTVETRILAAESCWASISGKHHNIFKEMAPQKKMQKTWKAENIYIKIKGEKATLTNKNGTTYGRENLSKDKATQYINNLDSIPLKEANLANLETSFKTKIDGLKTKIDNLTAVVTGHPPHHQKPPRREMPEFNQFVLKF